MPMPILIPRVLLVSGMALAPLCAGCTYSADVRNNTTGPVLVRMLQIDPVQPDWVLASERIGPGGYAKLGPSRVPFERVVVEVGNQMKNSVSARYSIVPGTTRLDVGRKPSQDSSRDEIVFTLEKRAE